MTVHNPDSPLKDIENALEEEYQALLSGDFVTLEKASEKRELAIGRLKAKAVSDDVQAYQRISADAQRNSELLKSAAQGVILAKSLLAEIKSVHLGHGTYDKYGKKPTERECQKFETKL